MSDAFIGLAIFIIAGLLGWFLAHGVVADECQKLGGFYVGSKVYECKAKP